MVSGLFIGIALGILLQRGQFCFVSGFRNIYTQRNFRFLTALFIAISIQSVGIFSLQAFGLISIPSSPMSWLATLLGGFVFGIGMTLANCCGSGAWFRSGEGLVGSWLALISFSLTMAATQTGALKDWINPLIYDQSELDTFHQTLNLSPWILVAVLIAVTLGLIAYLRKNPRYQPPVETTQAVIFPQFFAKRLSPFTTVAGMRGKWTHNSLCKKA